MTSRLLKPDLVGSNETLDDLLERLRSFSKQPVRPKGPPGFGHFVSSRRPPGGIGGAEAPIPADKAAPDCYAAA
ncbi:MAG: hypothetical protein KGO51_05815 [Alphaproteobacteria bacterium]|nr:hypothetical protein [Alphaproteobacteria bacterium]